MEKTTKRIDAKYHIADCEHRGDIERAEVYLRKLDSHIRIEGKHWDGKDCGEAYIEFSFPSTIFEKLYWKLYDNTIFYANINHYINLGGKSRFSGKYCSMETLNVMNNQLKRDVSEGWEERLPMMLFFQQDDNICSELIISKALGMFPKYEILGYCCDLVDSKIYHNLLFTCHIDDIDGEKMKEFGDYCLSHHDSFLNRNHIYGELSCQHILKNARDYDDFKTIVNRILEKKSLLYDSPFFSTPTILEYKDYVGENKIKTSFQGICGYIFKIPTYYNRVWEKYKKSKLFVGE